MRHLLAASGVEENFYPQFEAIVKDRLLKALPAKVAACSGNWFYKDLVGFAKCPTTVRTSNQINTIKTTQILLTI